MPGGASVVKAKNWYVIHTYAGYENKVKANLEKRVESMNVGDQIFHILVPMEEVMEVKAGKKKLVQKKIFPGYVLVEMILTDESWYVVRNTPGVTGFVGTGSKPIPLLEEEIEHILKHMGLAEAGPKETYNPGENVRVITGPFRNFMGLVEEVYPEKAKLKVLVTMFGRETPVEVDYSQVQKVD